MRRLNNIALRTLAICYGFFIGIQLIVATPNNLNTARAEAMVGPNRIVVFPICAEEVLLQLVDAERLIWVAHPYSEEATAFWPTMELTKDICGTMWQMCDDLDILALSPDLIVFPASMSDDYSNICPNLHQAQVPVVFVKVPEAIEDVFLLIDTLGHAVNAQDKAASLCAWFQNEINEIKSLTCKIPFDERKTVLLADEAQYGFQMLADLTGVINVLESQGDYIDFQDDEYASFDADIIVKRNIVFDANGLWFPVTDDATENDACVFITGFQSRYIIWDCYSLLKKAYPFLFD